MKCSVKGTEIGAVLEERFSVVIINSSFFVGKLFLTLHFFIIHAVSQPQERRPFDKRYQRLLIQKKCNQFREPQYM